MTTRRVKLRTTKAAIKRWQGRMRRCDCPIRVAALKLGISIDAYSVGYYVDGSTTNPTHWPKRITNWILALDAGKPVKPITVTIEVPI